MTIASGETTLKVLQMTRAAADRARTARPSCRRSRTGSSPRCSPCRPGEWGDLLGDGRHVRASGHLLLAWFRDPADQALVVRSGFDGAVRQDPGDYVYPVDAQRGAGHEAQRADDADRSDLEVQIDDVGNARNTLDVTWDNRVEAPEWAPYRAMVERRAGRSSGCTSGSSSRSGAASRRSPGEPSSPVTNPAVVEDEAGRTAIGTYLKVPPGETSLRLHVDEPVRRRRRRDRRHLPAHDPDAARHAARAAHAHDPGPGRATGSRPPARSCRGRVDGDAGRPPSTGTSSSALRYDR